MSFPVKKRRSGSLSALLLVSFILFSLHSGANSKQGNVVFQTESNEFTLDRIRVFYDRAGQHAVLSADSDKNGIPDQVEDIATQIWATYQYFCKALNFPDPFNSSRYKNLSFIEVSLLNRKLLKGSNGLAFDELMDSRGRDDKLGDKAIRINLSSDIEPTTNLTPSHEMFHLIQNGATYFKNSWFTEGMARWSETGLSNAVRANQDHTFDAFLQDEEANKKRLFKQSYAAAQSFWYQIAALDKGNNLVAEKEVIEQLRLLRYKQGLPVLHSGQIEGTGIMRSILNELNIQSDIAFRKLNYQKWSEQNQRSEKNNEYIFQAVKKTVSLLK